MWHGLTDSEIGLLRMSVGYGRRQRGRPLSPTEVGRLLTRALSRGASRSECAEKVRLNPSTIGRFVGLTSLPSEVQDWVDWGAPKDFVGFSSAAELVRLRDHHDQKIVAEAVLAQRLTSKEVRQVTQLRTRSGRPAQECVQEIVGMRPIVERRYVFMGAIAEDEIVSVLSEISQRDRDALLSSSLEDLGLESASGRLGSKIFTLVGGDDFGQSMQRVGKQSIEQRIRQHIWEHVQGGTASS